MKEKTYFQVSQMPSFRPQKETSKINRAQSLKWSRCKKKMYINTYTYLFYNKKVTYVIQKTHMVKITNVHKLAWFIFYENGAFVRVLESYLLRSASAVPIQKCDLKSFIPDIS